MSHVACGILKLLKFKNLRKYCNISIIISIALCQYVPHSLYIIDTAEVSL